MRREARPGRTSERWTEADIAEVEALMAEQGFHYPILRERTIPTDSHPPMSPDVAACREMSPDVRSGANRRNKPNPLHHAATEVADGLLHGAPVMHASATPVAAPGSHLGADIPTASVDPSSYLLMSPHVAACRGVSPDVRSDARAADIVPPVAVPLSLRAGAGGGLSEAQLAAVRMLLDGKRVTQIAADLQITTRTLLRWRKSDAFTAELRRVHDRRCAS